MKKTDVENALRNGDKLVSVGNKWTLNGDMVPTKVVTTLIREEKVEYERGNINKLKANPNVLF